MQTKSTININRRANLIHGLHSMLLLTIGIFLFNSGEAQQLPPAYNVQGVNTILECSPTSPQSTGGAGSFMQMPLKEVKISAQYIDGLGRSVQKVIKKGSLITDHLNPTSSANAADLVYTHLYDPFGREAKKFLPFAANNAGSNTHISDGLFKSNPFQQQAAFYNNTNSANPIKGQGETYFYSQANFEASPLNRVQETFAPGDSWVGTSGNSTENARRSVKTKYYINTAVDGVRIWKVTDNATIGNWGSYASPGAYPAGELYKTITADENNKQVIEFKDKEGKVILKKVQLTASSDDGSGNGHTGWLCTYYIYDGLNQLRCVIQPRGVELISSNWALTNATILAEQCFRYEYDELGRMIVKKAPGAGAVNMVYDKRDRLVMTQDANMLAQGKWLVTKYDDLNRPTETGLWSNATTVFAHRAAAKTPGTYPQTTSGYELLTETYYDDYNWVNSSGSTIINTGYETTWNSYLLAASTTVFPYPLANTKSTATKGMITGSKTKILGTSSYIYSMMIYDEKGRVIQLKSTNVTSSSGNYDVMTTQYGWQGLPMVTVQKQQKSGTNAQTITTVTKNNYDDLGRIVKVEKRQAHSLLNSGAMSAYSTISQIEYNALGQVKTKKLGTAPLETLTYDYNIRGWILGENRDYAADANNDHYFGFDLGYDKINNDLVGGKSYAAPQYNGNIAGTVWKSKGDGEKRKYDFTYDAINRLMKADFNQYTSGTFNKIANVDFSIKVGDGSSATSAYDANGNIKRMQQWGLTVGGSTQIDNMTYSYFPNTNKLQAVTEQGTGSTDYKMGDFTDKNTGTNDYGYDVNGNMVTDLNKKMNGNTGQTVSSGGAIVYNYLNLPQTINAKNDDNSNKGTITNIYDAVGNKLKKVTVDYCTAGKTITTTTTYINGFVYESKTTSPANIPNDDYTDRLQFMAHEEGRIRPARDVNNNITGFVYDYFLKDHLGNVRMMLTEEQKQDQYPAVTFEDASLANEQLYYDNVAVQRTGRPGPFFTSSTNGAKVQLLRKSTVAIGAAKLLKVMAGDKILTKVDYYIASQTTDNSTANGLNSILSSLLNLLNGIDAPTALKGSGTTITNDLGNSVPFTDLLEPQGPGVPSALPKAYLNIVFFDEQFKFVESGSVIIPANVVGTPTHIVRINQDAAVAQKNGYVYIYINNESNNLVYFDNLQVTHIRGPILEETHYYPFGLIQKGISTQAAGVLANKRKFGGKELQSKEFSDGSGLELYDFHARNFDPQIGRFWGGDKRADKLVQWSPYTYCLNNPIKFFDPDGEFPWPIWVRSFISANSVADGLFRGDGRGVSTSTDRNTTTSRAFVNFTYDPQKQALTNRNVDADNTVMYAPKEAGMGDRYPVISKKPDPIATFTEVSTEKNSLGNNIGSFGLDYSAKDPVTPGFATPSLDVHSSFSMTENLKTGTLSVNATFTGDVFPSTEAFISDQSGSKLFLGARKETGGIGELLGDNKKSLFKVNMQIKFDKEGNFIGVQQGKKLISVEDWNKKIQAEWNK